MMTEPSAPELPALSPSPQPQMLLLGSPANDTSEVAPPVEHVSPAIARLIDLTSVIEQTGQRLAGFRVQLVGLATEVIAGKWVSAGYPTDRRRFVNDTYDELVGLGAIPRRSRSASAKWREVIFVGSSGILGDGSLQIVRHETVIAWIRAEGGLERLYGKLVKEAGRDRAVGESPSAVRDRRLHEIDKCVAETEFPITDETLDFAELPVGRYAAIITVDGNSRFAIAIPFTDQAQSERHAASLARAWLRSIGAE